MMVSFCVLQTSTAHPGRRGDHRQFLTTHGTLPALTHRDAERLKETDREAQPSRIFANSGSLTLSFSGNSVSGTVHMTGLDNVGHEQVHYRASFSGSRTTLPLPPQ
jgi:hypothetical protein